ncbi:MAG: segregation/condensation protein A [Clostridia bacterium]|nr:segregation/condensation protein A [Clostridia bacterium]
MNEEKLEVVENKYSVSISNFEGPLDLLCFLISKNKKDIFEISLSELTDKYIEYLDSMSQMNMEIATEFLVMASTLLYIKSKKLLPVLEPEQNEEFEEMTEEELLQKIAIYKMYKEKQEQLLQMYRDNFGAFEKLPEKIKAKNETFIPANLSVQNILQSYSDIKQKNDDKINKKAEEIEKIAIYEKVTVKSKVKIILDYFKKKTTFIFGKLFSKTNNKKIDIVTAFLSVLELSRLKQVKVNQEGLFGDIVVEQIGNGDFDISLLKE